MNLNDVLLFAQSVECGGFAPAARRHGVPKSTLSKRVAALEHSLGVRLIARHSRGFQLTDVGRDFYRHARAALVEAEAATQVVKQRLAEPSGTVRLTAAVPVVQFQIAPHLPALAQACPKLQLQLEASDRFVDIVQEGFDIAVRSHFAPLPDSGLVQRVLATEPVYLLASPVYLQAHGQPGTPSELSQHAGLLTGPGAWLLRHEGSGQQEAVRPQARMFCNESVTLLYAASAGLGIVCLPETICRHHVERGELVRVLAPWTAGTVTTTALLPQRRGLLPSVDRVLTFLVERLGRAREP
jgi:DNA-binding transcriptional LysR family regulator